MTDMRAVIVPKSDQLNADDLIAGPMTIKITGVSIKGGQEQPIAISFDGDQGKPYKACKSMCRVMVTAWGPDSKKYAGRSMTLYRDPSVKWGGMEVGGIRISHMSDIDSAITMALTVTRANKRPYTVKPLKESAPPASDPAGIPAVTHQGAREGADTVYITPEQAMALEAQCTELGIVDAFKTKCQVERFALVLAADYDGALKWIAKRAKAGA